jgi:hypothetical protein
VTTVCAIALDAMTSGIPTETTQAMQKDLRLVCRVVCIVLSGSTAPIKKNFTSWQDFLKIFLNDLALAGVARPT